MYGEPTYEPTYPTVIRHDEVICDSQTSYIIQGCHVHNVAFIHGDNDVIDVSSRGTNVILWQTSDATVTDHTLGMHVSLDASSGGTTFVNMQQDPYARIDLFRSPFQDSADLASRLHVVPQGTVLDGAVNGPVVAFFPGDFNVRPEQFTIHH